MDTLAVLTFYMIEKIEREFKKFTGSHHAYASMVLQQYGIKVDFLNTLDGVVTCVDYDDIIRVFEKRPQQLAHKMGLRSIDAWRNR